MDESDIEANTSYERWARSRSCVRASHDWFWFYVCLLKKWGEVLFWPIVERSEAQPKQTQHYVFSTLSTTCQIICATASWMKQSTWFHSCPRSSVNSYFWNNLSACWVYFDIPAASRVYLLNISVLTWYTTSDFKRREQGCNFNVKQVK